MIGGICGDYIGSRFEGATQNPYDFDLFDRYCDFTDDTVLLIAVMDSLTSNSPIEKCLRDWCTRYPDRGYGGHFKKWLRSPGIGAYNSFGNGCAIRIGPVAFAANDKKTLIDKTREITCVTHNHPEGIKGAEAIALACWLARQGLTRSAIKEQIANEYHYDLSANIQTLHDRDIYEESCQVTVPIALVSALDANDFEDCIRRAVYVGGDSDSVACMSGCLGEILFGIPEEMIAQTKKQLPDEMISIIDKFYSQFNWGPNIAALKRDKLENDLKCDRPKSLTWRKRIVEFIGG